MVVTYTAPSDEPALANRVRTAVIWRSGSQIAAQILTWAATIIVVRMLTPDDYGLFAMSQVVLVALNFLNGHSFASSLIQEKEVTAHRIAQVFGLVILFNVVLATAQFIAAPYVAAYFHQPMIKDMLHAQVILYLVTPFIALPSVLLARRLNFRSQAKADMAGAVAGATAALSGAYAGLGVWTLVYAPIMQQMVRAIGLSVAAKMWMRPSFNFSGLRSIVTFGSALILCQFLWVIQSQADVAIAGPAMPTHQLGLYTEALFITLIFTAKFIPPLNEVAFPAYTQLAKEGGNIGWAFLTAARLLMFAAMPAYLGMAAVASPLVDVLLGPKWHAMTPIVAGLPLAMPFFALQIICSPTTNALGIPRIYVLANLSGAILFSTAFWLGSHYGTMGLVHAWQIAAPLLLLVTLMLTLPIIGVGWGQLLGAILPSCFAALSMYGAVRFASDHLSTLAPLPQLLILGGIGAATYLGLIWMFARDTITELLTFIKRKELGAAAQAV
jgi:O-antigen/teichoic acid export membrane protein